MKKLLQDLDQIKASDQLKQNTFKTIYEGSPRKKKKPILVFAMSACLLLLACLPTLWKDSPTKDTGVKQNIYTYVSVDINPSMEFQLDQKDAIVNVISYNQEAKKIFSDIDVKGMNVRKAIQKLVESDVITTYMKDGYLQISVYSNDSKHALKLETDIDASLSNTYSASQYGCNSASNVEHQEAQSLHMSFGKYQVIQLICAIDKNYKLEELQTMSMKELKTIYEKLSGKVLSQHCANGSDHHNGNGNGNGNGYRNGAGNGNGSNTTSQGHGHGNGYGNRH